MSEYYLIRDDRKFGVPEQKKFPMPDADHVRSAIKFFNYVDPKHEKQLARAILKRAKEYGLDISEMSIGDNNRFKKYLPINELKHHGILGQKWGKRNGPPYPLDEEDHSKAEKEAEKKRRFQLTEKQKKYIKIGAAVAVTALAAYGAYKLYSNRGMIKNYANLGKRNVDFIRKSGKFDYLDVKAGSSDSLVDSADYISESARTISETTGLPLKTKSYSAAEDIDFLRKNRPANQTSDCGPLAINFVLRRKGLNVKSVAVDNTDYKGGMSINEFGHYFKGIMKEITPVAIVEGQKNSEYKSQIISIINQKCGNEDGCGIVQINPAGAIGHFTTWYKENGKINFDDIQTDSSLIDRINWSKMSDAVVCRLDHLEVKAKNLLGNSMSDILEITKSAS